MTTRAGDVEVALRAPVEGPDATRRGPDEPPERVYRLKIELEECNWTVPEEEVSRTVELAGDDTLHDLHGIIQQAFGWDDDHCYDFFVSGKLRDWDTCFPGSPEGDVEPFFDVEGESRSVEETRLDDLGLVRRRAMRYVYDEGIVNKITVSTIRGGGPEDAGLPRLVAQTGEVPSQYGTAEE